MLAPSMMNQESSTDATVGAAMSRARRAQADWRGTATGDRLRRVAKFRHLLADQASELASSLSLPERTVSAETLVAEVLPLAEACRFLERRARTVLRPRSLGGLRSRLPGGIAIRIERSPWGLVLIVCAGNYPLFLPGVQILQSLVAGNAVVVKPAPGTADAIRRLATLFVGAGFPRDLIVVLDESRESVSSAIGRRVDKILFTGSSSTGRSILEQAARTLTPSTLELSGCDAVFVHPEADLEMVADALEFGLRFNRSATCIAPRRVIADSATTAELEKRLAARLSELDPMSLPPERHQQVRELVSEAVASGARRVAMTGGRDALGSAVLLAGVSPEMAVAHADVFAPILSLLKAETFDEALEVDSQCPYALGASVFGPEAKALAWADRIEAGVVVVNDLIAPTAHPAVPFGGRGQSGFGVTRGAEGLLEMTRPKAVLQRRGSWRPHYQSLGVSDTSLFTSFIQARHKSNWTERLRSWVAVVREARAKTRGARR